MLLIYLDGKRLCRDYIFRDFAPIGTERWCIKQYAKRSAAAKMCRRIKHSVVVEVPDGFVVDACGRVYNDTRQVPLEELIVMPPFMVTNPTSVQPLLFGRGSHKT